MSCTEKANVYVANTYEFTACCGGAINKDDNTCTKCDRPIDKVFGVDNKLNFAHDIWYNTLRTQFLMDVQVFESDYDKVAT
jgi:hypothetical protein